MLRNTPKELLAVRLQVCESKAPMDRMLSIKLTLGAQMVGTWNAPSMSTLAATAMPTPAIRSANGHAGAALFWASPSRLQSTARNLQQMVAAAGTYPIGRGCCHPYANSYDRSWDGLAASI